MVRRVASMVRVLCVLVLLPTLAHADDWPTFLGPAGNGTSKETGLAKTFPANGPARLWEKKVGSGYAGPVVVSDRLVLFHRLDDEEIIECLDASKGTPKWKFAYPCRYVDNFGKGNGPRSTPAVAQGIVVTLGADGVMHALSLDAGDKKWTRNLMSDYKVPPSYFGVGTSPRIHGDLVLVNVGGKEAGIIALELATGKEKWRATKDGASYSTPLLADVAGAPRALFLTRNGAVILDPRDGAVHFTKRWRARYDASVNAATPLVAGHLAVFSSSYETGALLVKLKADGADVVWTSEDAMSNHYNTGVLVAGHVFGIDGRQEAGARLRCVSLDGPTVAWSKEGFGCASILFADGKLLLLTESGDLVLAEPSTKAYRESARAKILSETPVRAVPALSSGRLFARDQGRLIAIDLKSQ